MQSGGIDEKRGVGYGRCMQKHRRTTRPPTSPSAPQRLVARHIDSVKAQLHEMLDEVMDGCVAQARKGASTAELERATGLAVAALGQRMIALVFARACQEVMLQDLRERGLSRSDIRLRTDESGYATVHTTLGPVTFPIFAYRDLTTPCGSVTRAPARKLFPFHRHCRSSPLCLEWEARLGAQHPFRKAEELFYFFTRGASTVEDNTISRHMLALTSMVEPEWLYRTPEDIRQILMEKATRDRKTGKPLLYFSTDAHALRRYVGATWTTNWKMINGLRLWCEDAESGALIHLGGEFTWGDCREVRSRVEDLIQVGILPGHDAAWDDVNVELVFVSDGSEWIVEHLIFPLFGAATVIIDPYHVLEWFGDLTAVLFGRGSKRTQALLRSVREVLLGSALATTEKAPKTRKGHRKKKRPKRPHAHDHHAGPDARRSLPKPGATTDALLRLLADVPARSARQEEAIESLVTRLATNSFRLDYEGYLKRGIQIGSGAMESLHRSGSQRRMKLPGAWTEEMSISVLRFRMLELSRRWDEFWGRADLVPRIAQAFALQSEVLKSAA